MTLRWALHNLVAHPMLVLCPPIGEWLHEISEPAIAADPVPVSEFDEPHKL